MSKEKVYPEKVSAIMYKIPGATGGKPILLRRHTNIRIGVGEKFVGSVFMTNPGSFTLKGCKGWDEFQQNESKDVLRFDGEDYADPTMQMIIELVRQAYYPEKPNGIIHIYNISNVVQPKGKLAKVTHQQAIDLLTNKNHLEPDCRLQDPSIVEHGEFLQVIAQSDFVIFGFKAGAFKNDVSRLMAWSMGIEVLGKRVTAIDKKGRFSHPRRWRTEPELLENAVEQLKGIIPVRRLS